MIPKFKEQLTVLEKDLTKFEIPEDKVVELIYRFFIVDFFKASS